MHLPSPSPCCIIGGAGRPSGRGARSLPSPLLSQQRSTGKEPGGRCLGRDCSPLRLMGCPCSHHHQGHHSDGPAALIHMPDCNNPTPGIMPIPTDACDGGSTGTPKLTRRPEAPHGGGPCSRTRWGLCDHDRVDTGSGQGQIVSWIFPAQGKKEAHCCRLPLRPGAGDG